MNSTQLIEQANILKNLHKKIRDEGEQIFIASMNATKEFAENPTQEKREKVELFLEQIQEIRERGQKTIEEIDLLLKQIEEKQTEERADLLELSIALEEFSKNQA